MWFTKKKRFATAISMFKDKKKVGGENTLAKLPKTCEPHLKRIVSQQGIVEERIKRTGKRCFHLWILLFNDLVY